MVPKLILAIFCALLVGCAAGPSTREPVPDNPTQKQQAAEAAARAARALQQGNKEQARAAYRTALDLNPGDAVAANNLALLLREHGQFHEAVKLLQTGLEYSPDTAELHYNLAVIAELYLLDLELALAHYREYQALAEPKAEPDGQLVAGWIADLERRVE